METKSSFEFWFKRKHPEIPVAAALHLLQEYKNGKSLGYLVHFQSDLVAGMSLAQAYEVLQAEFDWKEIERKQEHLIREIQAQNKLSDELKKSIERTYDLDRLEDYYLPYKLKRSQLTTLAREAGLQPLADHIWQLGHGESPSDAIAGNSLLEKAQSFAKADTKYSDAEAVLKGVLDLLVERIAENAELRGQVRQAVLRRSKLTSSKGTKTKANSKYSRYFSYQEPIGSLKKPDSSFRYLQMRKGWMDDELVLAFDRPEEGELTEKFESFATNQKDSDVAEILLKASRLALKGNVYTVVENDTHRYLKEHAERDVIRSLTFALEMKLRQPAFGFSPVMGVEADSAENWQIAVIDAQGKLVFNGKLNIANALSDENVKAEFIRSLENLKISLIAIANGPHSKAVRKKLAELLQGSAQASILVQTIFEPYSNIYSSCASAKEEFPDLSGDIRRAVFVARYCQEPLMAVVKLDPKFLCLSDLHSELNPTQLRRAVVHAIEAVACNVGIDINKTNWELLSKLPSLNPDLAKAIIAEREKKGSFHSREEIAKVAGVDDKIYQSVIGFLRIKGGAEAYDNTGIHPAQYALAKSALARLGMQAGEITEEQKAQLAADSELLALGEKTAASLAYKIFWGSKDPRGQYAPFLPVLENPSLDALEQNRPYKGVVTNVTSFGAFVDIGLEQDCLVHTSQFEDRQANPLTAYTPGEEVEVFVFFLNK